MLGQQEDQMINQIGMYDRVVRKSVTLPIVKNDFDSWYCQRLINEALLELNHHGKGPVHINVPVPAVITWDKDEEIEEYPKVKAIHRIELADTYEVKLQEKASELSRKKRIMVIAGQKQDDSNMDYLNEFFSKFNCVIVAEHMGNAAVKGKLNLMAVSNGIPVTEWETYLPDLVISFNGTMAITRNLKETFRIKKLEHWIINEDGVVVDAYRNLTTIFEGKPQKFFEYMNSHVDSKSKNNMEYYNLWKKTIDKHKDIEIPYSNVYAIKTAISNLPSNINLHLSILNSIRLSNYFELPKDVKVYANVGTDGIDGCMSSFFGQADVTDKECFLFIGDLSFFYDMSSVRIKHNKPNAHIMLINNHGGNEFYLQTLMPTTDQGLGAKHANNAKAWVESCGFRYLCSHNKEEFDKNIKEFVKDNQKQPVLFEVFTDQMTDRETIGKLRRSYSVIFDKHAAAKQAVKEMLGENTVKGIKHLLGRVK